MYVPIPTATTLFLMMYLIIGAVMALMAVTAGQRKLNFWAISSIVLGWVVYAAILIATYTKKE